MLLHAEVVRMNERMDIVLIKRKQLENEEGPADAFKSLQTFIRLFPFPLNLPFRDILLSTRAEKFRRLLSSCPKTHSKDEKQGEIDSTRWGWGRGGSKLKQNRFLRMAEQSGASM